MSEQWSPWFAWAMDLSKSVITLGLTVLGTVWIVNRIQARLASQRSRADALFQLQMDTLHEFSKATATYEVAALTAYVDIYQWKSKDKTEGMQRYEGMAFGEFLAALDELKQRFAENPEVMQLIDDLHQTNERRHEIYNSLVDEQLDTGPLSNIRNLANSKRKSFDDLLNQVTSLRRTIISAVQKDILGDP